MLPIAHIHDIVLNVAAILIIFPLQANVEVNEHFVCFSCVDGGYPTAFTQKTNPSFNYQ